MNMQIPGSEVLSVDWLNPFDERTLASLSGCVISVQFSCISQTGDSVHFISKYSKVKLGYITVRSKA